MLKIKKLTRNEKYTLNFFSVLLTTCVVLISLCSIYFDVALELTNFQWGLLFTSLMFIVVSLSRLNGISILSITSLFTLTIMLFLGGRFLAALIDPESKIFQLSYFTSYTLDDKESTQLFFFVITGIFAIQAGQYIARFSKNIPKYSLKIPQRSLQKVINITLPLFAIGIGSIVFQKIIDVLKFGYLGLYMHQAEGNFSSTISSLVNTFFYVFLGITFAYGRKSQKIAYFTILCILSLIMLFLGARGPFGAFLLFLLWLYGDLGRRRFSLLNFFIFALIAIFLLNYLIDLISVRELSTGSTLIERVHKFLYTQGITLMVFDVSTQIPDYPTPAYIKSFIPGSSFIAKITGLDNSLTNLDFAHYLASNLNKDLYQNGAGLGWTIYSDFYLLSNQSLLIFSLIFITFGYLLTKLELIARQSTWIYGLLVTIAINIFFVARSSLSTIIPLGIYYIIIITIIVITITFLQDSSRNHSP